MSLSLDRLPGGIVDTIKNLSGRDVMVSTNEAEIEKNLDDIEIAAGNLPFALLSRASNLAWVQLWTAGADMVQKYPELKTKPFIMTSVSGVHGPQMAEHLFGMILAFTRKLQFAFAAQRSHEWFHPRSERMIKLTGKQMLILGYGKIGKEFALIARAFGMEVTGLRHHVPEGGKDDAGISVKPSSQLMDLLPDADFVVNILPLTPETENFIGEHFFEKMKSSGVYINIGRGLTTRENDLINALREKKIAGALLDATREEPLRKDSALWDMDNVIITGHYAGATSDYHKQCMDIFLKNLELYINGRPLINVVDKIKGY